MGLYKIDDRNGRPSGAENCSKVLHVCEKVLDYDVLIMNGTVGSYSFSPLTNRERT